MKDKIIEYESVIIDMLKVDLIYSAFEKIGSETLHQIIIIMAGRENEIKINYEDVDQRNQAYRAMCEDLRNRYNDPHSKKDNRQLELIENE